jgi:multimeric flavodoxin WrbA
MNPSRSRIVVPALRTGQGSTRLSREEFSRRYQAQFYDPAFDEAKEEIQRLTDIAWEAYQDRRKSARTRPAGPEFSDPDQELSVEWLQARTAIREAEKIQKSGEGDARILVICASPRTDETCPGEMSKSFRIAKEVCGQIGQTGGFVTDLLDLSLLDSEYGRRIFPCKACVSTAMPLCHWPCSCYPHHALGQTQDWMLELYPRWVAAHGVMIITPVHWNQAPSGLKLMMDRLVCADGGNPDPTTTDGKDAAKAKAIELAGWPYPRHLAGRIFSLIVHGDTEGADAVRHALHDWLTAMELVSAGPAAEFDRYIGYYEPYATSHEALDRDTAFMQEAANAATTLMEAVREMRRGREEPGHDVESPRSK